MKTYLLVNVHDSAAVGKVGGRPPHLAFARPELGDEPLSGEWSIGNAELENEYFAIETSADRATAIYDGLEMVARARNKRLRMHIRQSLPELARVY